MAISSFSRLTRQHHRAVLFVSLVCMIPSASISAVKAERPVTSLEIRWFVNGDPPEAVERWFLTDARLGPHLKADEADSRADVYLLAGDRQDLTIKLRDGRLELRERTGNPDVLKVSTFSGVAELWRKWEWKYHRADSTDNVADAFAVPRGPGLRVGKRRYQRKFDQQRDGSFIPVLPTTRIDQGCLVEYTSVSAGPRRAWTVAIESVGPNDDVLRSTLESCLPRLLEGFPQGVLIPANSYSYAAFLRQ